MVEIVRSSVLKLVQESKSKGNFSLNRLAEHVYSMLQSELLVRCYDIVNIVNRPSILVRIQKLSDNQFACYYNI